MKLEIGSKYYLSGMSVEWTYIGEFGTAYVFARDYCGYTETRGLRDIRHIKKVDNYSDWKIDEPAVFTSEYHVRLAKGHFAGVSNGRPGMWPNGATSFTTRYDLSIIYFDNCRRPTKEELGE